MTLRPNPAVAADLAPLTSSAAARGVPAHVLIGLAGNVVVFVPLGATLALALGGQPVGRQLLLAMLIGAGLSLAIELAQRAIPTRVSGLNDWVLNIVGTALGALLGLEIKKPGFWIRSVLGCHTKRSQE